MIQQATENTSTLSSAARALLARVAPILARGGPEPGDYDGLHAWCRDVAYARATGSVGARVVYGPPPVYSVPHHPHAGPPVLDWQYARRQAKYEREAYKRWRKGQREHYKRAREFQREREKADREFERERIKDQREAAREYDRWRREVEREQRRERRKRW